MRLVFSCFNISDGWRYVLLTGWLVYICMRCVDLVLVRPLLLERMASVLYVLFIDSNAFITTECFPAPIIDGWLPPKRNRRATVATRRSAEPPPH